MLAPEEVVYNIDNVVNFYTAAQDIDHHSIHVYMSFLNGGRRTCSKVMPGQILRNLLGYASLDQSTQDLRIL